jgi:DNA adenine methylase
VALREARGITKRFGGLSALKAVDFARLVLHEDDFVYADPPYDVEFTQYASQGFTWEQQIRTAEWLSQHPGPVILVNQATPRIVKLYRSRIRLDI